jgi:glycosyltransferase involved in cell wall biosynthesis
VIVQIIPFLGVGGAEQGCLDMALAIKAAGGVPIVVSQGGSPAKLQELVRHNIRHVVLPVQSKNPWTMLRNIGRIEKLLRSVSADLVHVRSRAPAWSAFYAARRAGVPFMTTCHAPYNARNALKRAYNRIMSRGVRVIAISNFVADYLRRKHHIGDDVIRLVHRSVDIFRLHPSKVTPDRLIRMTQLWRAPDGATIILLPGRLTQWKGHAVLIEALSMINHPDVFCVLQGSDQGRSDYTRELHRLIAKHHLGGKVRIVDHDDDTPAMFMAAHIVISASTDPEGFGRTSIEGLAMGRIVIASNHGGSRETIVDGVTGFLVPPGDPAALARMIDQAVEMSLEERAAMGARGMAAVKENFTREVFMERTLAVYNEILAERAT